MNTERVKNILIVLFSLVALMLAAFVFVDEGRYNLSDAQEAAIVSLLAHNDVFLDERMDILRNFRPMRPLDLQIYNYSISDMAARFFGDSAPQIEIEGANMYFFSDDREMMYSYLHNWVIFEIPGGISNEAFLESSGGAAAAERLAKEYIEELLGMPPGMEHTSTSLSRQRQNQYVISFFSDYRGHRLHNDHIRVTVADTGITYILYSRVQNNGFFGESRGIFSADEALLALLNHLRHIQIEEGPVIITEMRLAYYIAGDEGAREGVPAYVFTAMHEPSELMFNFVFNAFTNEYVWHEIIR